MFLNPHSHIRFFFLLLFREFRIEGKTLTWLGTTGFFGLQIVVLLGLGFSSEPAGETKTQLTMAAYWLGIIFAGTLGTNRAFYQEYQSGALSGLLLLPYDRSVIYLAKVFSSMIFLGIILSAMTLIAGVFLNLPVFQYASLLLPVLALAALGYVAIGTLLAAMICTTKGRDSLLAATLFPVLVPLFLGATSAGREIIAGGGLTSIQEELLLLLTFDAFYLAVGIFLFEKVVEG